MSGIQKNSEGMEGAGGTKRDMEVGMCLVSLKELAGLITLVCTGTAKQASKILKPFAPLDQ